MVWYEFIFYRISEIIHTSMHKHMIRISASMTVVNRLTPPETHNCNAAMKSASGDHGAKMKKRRKQIPVTSKN